MIEFGEFTGMFIMLFIGLGSGIVITNKSCLLSGCCWGIAVLVGSLIGNLFGTTFMNPIFSLSSLATGVITLQIFVKQVLGQILGAVSASVLLYLFFHNRYSLSLTTFAAVAHGRFLKINFLLEIIGSFTLLYVSNILNTVFSQAIFRTFTMSLLISFLVMIIGPVTGASFNPIRDFIPRTIFSIAHGGLGRKHFQTKSILTSNLAPIVATILFIVFLRL